jgi:uncharacterized membrane protein
MRPNLVVSILAAFAIASSPASAQTPGPEASAAAAATATAAPAAFPDRLAPKLDTPPLQTITFEACNKMPYLIVVAVAYQEGKGETARGWQPIAAGTCTTMGPFPINRKRFSFFATARTGGRSRKDWAGSSYFCVNAGASFTYENAARANPDALCPDPPSIVPDQSPIRPFISVTPAMLLPNDPAKRDDPALRFKFNFSG